MSRTTAYYDADPLAYDQIHGNDANPECLRALEAIWSILRGHNISSALDVGCGTGWSLKWLRTHNPSIALSGVDPSDGLLAICKRSLPGATLQRANGERLPFEDNSVDLALAMGIMHHVDNPTAVISEMFRVARKAVLILDHNNFAFGSTAARRIRMILEMCGLLSLAIYVKQGFNRQGYSKEDGWWYPYSLFDNYGQIDRLSDEMFLMPTRPANTEAMGNLLFSQSHVAILAIKRRP